jgi:hypothetical protein
MHLEDYYEEVAGSATLRKRKDKGWRYFVTRLEKRLSGK